MNDSASHFSLLIRTTLVSLAMLATPQPALAQPAAIHDNKPSRAAEKGCAWEKFSDAKLGLDAWVQRCAFGGRKTDFVAVGHSLAMRYSDGGAPEPVLDVFDLKPGEVPEAGLRRLFAERTNKTLAVQCVLAPFHDKFLKTPAGVKRYTFVPNAAYAKVVKAKELPGDMPDSACGDWGDMPDGIQYWEAQPQGGVAKVLFVRYGQDTPLFDDATLKVR